MASLVNKIFVIFPFIDVVEIKFYAIVNFELN